MKINEKKSKKSTYIIDFIIEKKDYTEKVDSTLKNYRKKANIPGFRKGNVPVGLIKKQYGMAVKVDEINKIIQNEISKYISENNISILGSPLPYEEHEVDWTKDEINLKFEIAHTPQFKINYKSKKPPTYYTIEADNEMISSQVESIQNQYGKLITLEFPDKECTILGKVKLLESENEKSLSLDSQKFKKGFFSKYLSKSKVGSSIKINKKSFNDEQYLHSLFNKEENEFLSGDLTLQITEISKREKAGKTLYIAAWIVEIFAVGTGLLIALTNPYLSYDEIENPGMMHRAQLFIGILPLIVIAVVEGTKIPLAQGFYMSKMLRWKILFLTSINLYSMNLTVDGSFKNPPDATR